MILDNEDLTKRQYEQELKITLLENRVRDLEIWIKRLIYHMKHEESDYMGSELFDWHLIRHILQLDSEDWGCKDIR